MADLTHHDIDHLIADLREVTRPQVDQVPPHMKTMSELVAAMGGSRRRIEEMVRKAVESGRWCRKTYRIENGARGVYPTPHYGPVQRKK